MWKSLLLVLVVAGMVPAATSLATDNGAPNLISSLKFARRIQSSMAISGRLEPSFYLRPSSIRPR